MKKEEEDELSDENIVKFPDSGEPIARYNISLDEAKRGEDGTWELVRTVKQVLTFDNIIYFIREQGFKAIDKDFHKASDTTHRAIGLLLEEYGEDFWSKPEWDGMQYYMQDGLDSVKLEEHHGILEDVTNTKA